MSFIRTLATIAFAVSLVLPDASRRAGLRLSEPEDHLHGRLRSGRRHRYDRPRAGAGTDRAVRLSDRDREPSRRGVEYRRPRGRERGAGRLHVSGHRQQPRDQPDLLQESRLYDQRARADRVLGARQHGDRRPRRQSGAHLGRVHGGGERQADQLRLRRVVGTHRQRVRLQGAGQVAGNGGAVPERRAGAERAAGRPRRRRRRPDRGDLPAGAARQAACARGHRPEALARAAGRADLARGRARRDRGLWLERHPGAGKNPAGDRAQGQRRGQCGGGHAGASSSGCARWATSPYSLAAAPRRRRSSRSRSRPGRR